MSVVCLRKSHYVFFVFCRKKVPAVPESLLKRRKAFAIMKAMRVKKMLAEKKVGPKTWDIISYKTLDFTCICLISDSSISLGLTEDGYVCPQARKVTRKLIYKRAEKYHKEYRSMFRREVRLSPYCPQKWENYYVPAEPKLAFVMRIRGWVESSVWEQNSPCLAQSWQHLHGLLVKTDCDSNIKLHVFDTNGTLKLSSLGQVSSVKSWVKLSLNPCGLCLNLAGYMC